LRIQSHNGLVHNDFYALLYIHCEADGYGHTHGPRLSDSLHDAEPDSDGRCLGFLKPPQLSIGIRRGLCELLALPVRLYEPSRFCVGFWIRIGIYTTNTNIYFIA